MNIDVFLCYRRSGAQTAKLFKKYGVSAEENILIQYVKDMVA